MGVVAGDVEAKALAREGLVYFMADSALSAKDLEKLEAPWTRRRDACLSWLGYGVTTATCVKH